MTESTPQEPQQQDDNENVKIEDGQVFVAEDGPADDSPEEPSSQEHQDADTNTDHATEVPEKFQGKSVAEMAQILADRDRTISKQGEELSKYRKNQEILEMDPDEARDKLQPSDLRQVLVEEQQKLAQLDPDDEDYQVQLKRIAKVEDDYNRAVARDSVREELVNMENQTLIPQQRQRLQESGVDLNDDEFQELVDYAKNYSADGRVNWDAMNMAGIRKYGSDTWNTFFKMQGKQEREHEIMQASGKEEQNLKPQKGGKRWVKLSEDPQARRRQLEKLSDAELQRVISRAP